MDKTMKKLMILQYWWLAANSLDLIHGVFEFPEENLSDVIQRYKYDWQLF